MIGCENKVPKKIKETEKETLARFASELWHITVRIGNHVTDQHPIWIEGESLRRRAELMKVRAKLDEARELLLSIVKEKETN